MVLRTWPVLVVFQCGKGYTAKVCKNLEHEGDVLCHILSAKKTWHKADGVCQISESVTKPQVHVIGTNVVHCGVIFCF